MFKVREHLAKKPWCIAIMNLRYHSTAIAAVYWLRIPLRISTSYAVRNANGVCVPNCDRSSKLTMGSEIPFPFRITSKIHDSCGNHGVINDYVVGF